MEARQYIPNYTIADYLKWEGDWELWHGVPVSMSPSPNRRHQRIGGRLYRMFQEQLEHDQTCRCEAIYEVDWRIADNMVVCPDLVIECEPNDAPYIVKPPALIVEVLSPTTERRDHEDKYRLYEAEGVKHYLMISTDLNMILAYTLQNGLYKEIAPDEPLELHDGCSVQIYTDGLWDR